MFDRQEQKIWEDNNHINCVRKSPFSFIVSSGLSLSLIQLSFIFPAITLTFSPNQNSFLLRQNFSGQCLLIRFSRSSHAHFFRDFIWVVNYMIILEWWFFMVRSCQKLTTNIRHISRPRTRKKKDLKFSSDTFHLHTNGKCLVIGTVTSINNTHKKSQLNKSVNEYISEEYTTDGCVQIFSNKILPMLFGTQLTLAILVAGYRGNI